MARTCAAEEPRRPAARKPARKPAPRAAPRTKASAAKPPPSAAAVAASKQADEPAPSADGEDADDSDADVQRKLGRPLAYRGDPDAPELTDAERRKIKRCVARRPRSLLGLEGARLCRPMRWLASVVDAWMCARGGGKAQRGCHLCLDV